MAKITLTDVTPEEQATVDEMQARFGPDTLDLKVINLIEEYTNMFRREQVASMIATAQTDAGVKANLDDAVSAAKIVTDAAKEAEAEAIAAEAAAVEVVIEVKP